jgi:hypothetical protein
MSFQPTFSITNRMTQAITRIERARAVTPPSSFASSREKKDSGFQGMCAFRGSPFSRLSCVSRFQKMIFEGCLRADLFEVIPGEGITQ